MSSSFVVLFAFFVAFACSEPKCSHFSSSRLYLVDYNLTTHTFFFRGNFPGGYLNSTSVFGMKLLRDAILEKAKELKLPIQSDFFTIDISLLAFNDQCRTVLEKDYWDTHSQEGRLIGWTTLGVSLNASELSKTERDIILDSYAWDIDFLTKRIPEVHEMVNTDFGHSSTVLYVHCASGVDRTGEVCGSYQMLFRHWTFQQALAWDDKIKGKEITDSHARSMNWYCYWLAKNHGLHSLDCERWF